jgi:GNAT superfamily N-acetyltransferase
MATRKADESWHHNAEIAREQQAKFARKSMEKFDRQKAMEPKPPIALRPMVIDDASYVLDSWANSYRRSPATGPIEREVFNIEQRARINRLVSRPHSRVVIACDAQDRDKIRGWLCFEGPQGDDGMPIVHYVCVQPAYQLQGIGTGLVALARQAARDPELPMWSTHETAPMRHIREKWNLLFNPYLLEVADRVAATKPKDLFK